MSPARVRAYKRVIRLWQRAGLDNATIAHTISAVNDGECDPFVLDTALGSAAALDPRMARQMNEATGPASRGL